MLDQCGRQVSVEGVPKRIICTVPSLTEYLFDLGLDEQIIGVTKFCVNPKSLTKKKEKIGGTKNLRIEDIKALQPDLIIANKEENTKEDILKLEKEFPIYLSRISNIEDAIAALKDIAELTGRAEKGAAIIDIILSKKNELLPDKEKFKVVYLIWKNPYMTVGSDTFIHSMLEAGGFENLFSNRQRYPSISLAQIKSLNPDFVFLSSEPFPFKEEDGREIKDVVNCDIIAVDGELFSWYGSRMIFAFKYLEDLHSDLKSLTD